MKNGNYNEIEEILQKRFKGVKDDIKDPGFINIEYKEKEKKESFFKKPAVYAAGLVLVAVLVCGGTFIGLKYMEKLGADQPGTTPETTFETTYEEEGEAPVYMSVTCGDQTIYPASYVLCFSGYSEEQDAWIEGDGFGAEGATNVPKIKYSGDIAVEYKRDGVEFMNYRISDGNGETKYTHESVDPADTLESYLKNAKQGVYRVVAHFTLHDSKSSSEWEYPFDIEIVFAATTGESVTDTETEPETETEDPIKMSVSSGGKKIYPTAYLGTVSGYDPENGGYFDGIGPGAASAESVPKIRFDTEIFVSYDKDASLSGYFITGENGDDYYIKEQTDKDDTLSGYLLRIVPGVYRVKAIFSVRDGQIHSDWECPFDVEILQKETTETDAETETVTETETETDIITETETEAATESGSADTAEDISLIRLYSNETGAVDVPPRLYRHPDTNEKVYFERDAFPWAYYSDSLRIEAVGETEFTLIESYVSDMSGNSEKTTHRTLKELNDHIKENAAKPRANSTVIEIEVKYGAYIYRYVIEIILHEAHYPAYPSVSSGGKNIYPEAYYTDDDEAVFAAEAPQITLGDGGLTVGYSENGVVSVSYRIADTEKQNLTLEELNGYLKNAPAGKYRVVIDFSVIRGDEGEYKEESVFKYPFDVKIQSAETETYPPQEFIDLIEIRVNGEKINGLIPEWETFTGYELEIVGREDILIYYKTGMTVSAINKASVVSVESTVRVQGGYNDPVSHNSLDSLNNAITKALQDGADSIYITVDAKNSNAYAHYSFEIMFGQKGKEPVYLSVAGDGRIYPDAYPDHVDVYENGKTVKTTGNGVSDAKNIPTVNYGEGLSVNYSALTDKYLPQRLIKYELYDINSGEILAQGPTVNRLNAYLESASSGIYRAVVSFYLNDFNMNDGTTVTGYYVYPFNVYVEYKEKSDAKRPVYLTVSNGDKTVYPDGYFCWSEMYDDREGLWIDGCNGLAPSYVAVIKYDGGDLVFRYDDAGNGTEIEGIGCYDENENPCYPSVETFDDLNRFFKTADNGVYRVYVSFIIKGRLIDGKYERECWGYVVDVAVDDNVQHPEG